MPRWPTRWWCGSIASSMPRFWRALRPREVYMGDATNMPLASILVIDDDAVNLKLVGGLLSERGYTVRLWPQAEMALRSAQAKPPDLVLLDIRLPDMDGYAVCEALKADACTHDVPVIFCSALGETIDKVRAFAVGGVDYI